MFDNLRELSDAPLYEDDQNQDDGKQGMSAELHTPADYIRHHLKAAHEAIEAGVRLDGYYVWSLLDNFEWWDGYRPRFGIIRVDYDSLRRTPKASYNWYREVIARNGLAW